MLNGELNGSFKLQNQLCLNTPPIMCENSQSSVDEVASLSEDKHSAIAFSKKAIHQQDADENLFLRFLELDPETAPPTPAPQQSTPSSQRRQSSIKNVLMQSSPAAPVVNLPPATTPAGRTPFTVTKKLQRHQEKGYGFSIVWTHPPRVEKVEAHLPAERAGILPGDFVIFVDKHNVVTMPELDILNLIRSQGSTLTLEIFRRPAGQSSTSRPLSALMKTPSLGSERHERITTNNPELLTFNGNLNNNKEAVKIPNRGNEGVSNVNSMTSKMNGGEEVEGNNNRVVRPMGARSSIGCSSASMETAKRRLHLPQVTFSKEVGHGVVV